MNLIWLLIIISSMIYAIVTNRINILIDNLFNVPKDTLNLLFTIGGLIIIYSGIFKIAYKSGLIEKMSILIKPLVNKIIKNENDEVKQLICANIVANLLGLGLATTPIALKCFQLMNKNNVITKNQIILIVLNISAFTLFPLTVMTIREQYNSNIGIFIWLSLIIITFVTSIISLLITKRIKDDIYN